MNNLNPGVRCPKCRCPHLPALDTRRRGRWTIRRRQCRGCGHILRTREESIQPPAKISPEKPSRDLDD